MCDRCRKSVNDQTAMHFMTKQLLIVLCEDCNKEWKGYFSERFNREHGTLLGFHTPIELREKILWFKEFLNEQEKVNFT